MNLWLYLLVQSKLLNYRYHVDYIVETLEKFEIKAVGIYGKMSQ
jgi:hypothetical protein